MTSGIERGKKMDETVNDGTEKRGFPKKIIAIIVIAVLVIGGSVAAYVMFNLSDKEKYFLAEKKSFEFMADKVEERFQPELDWLEQSKENPTESVTELSAEYNDASGVGLGMDPAEIINNATLTFSAQTDMEKKQLATDVKGSFGGISIDGFHFYLTDKKAMLDLPFLEELMQIQEEDVGNLLHELDPYTFTGEEEPDFDTFFEGNVLSEEDQAYLKKEYAEMIFDKLPDSAFEVTKETVKVKDDSIDTEKITMDLSEEEVKDILSATFEKMQQDDRLKEIIKEQYEIQQFGMPDTDFDNMMKEFDTALEDAQDELKDFQIPDGITSTIWINDKLIVKREFSVEMGPSSDQLVALDVDGTQSLKDEQQTFDYDLTVTENHNEETVSITGDLSSKDDKSKDSIKLAVDGMELGYNANSTLKDGKRDFEREITADGAGENGKIIWTGNANYEKDQMSSEHNISFDGPELSQDMFALHIKNDAKTIKSVDIPEEDNVKDLGSMDANELTDYFETEVAPQAQQWMMGLLGGGAMGF